MLEEINSKIQKFTMEIKGSTRTISKIKKNTGITSKAIEEDNTKAALAARNFLNLVTPEIEAAKSESIAKKEYKSVIIFGQTNSEESNMLAGRTNGRRRIYADVKPITASYSDDGLRQLDEEKISIILQTITPSERSECESENNLCS